MIEGDSSTLGRSQPATKGSAAAGGEDLGPQKDKPTSAAPIRVIGPEDFEADGADRAFRRRLVVFGLVGGAIVAAGVIVVKPLLQSSSSPQILNRPPAVSQSPAPASAAASAPSAELYAASREVGRLVVVSELPEEAWLEVDGEVFASGLGIRLPMRVTGGTTHQISLHAVGYRSWESSVFIATDSLVRLEVTLERTAPRRTVRVERAPESQPPETNPAERPLTTRSARPMAGDPRPPFPPALRDSLVLRIEEGRVLHQIGRYFGAAAEYQYVIDRVASASVRFRGVGALETLRAKADSGLVSVRTECRTRDQPRCP